MKYDLTYLSFGGGTQSTTLLALSALGLRGVPRADVAIFADTQAELPDTYEHIALMTRWAADRGIPVKTVTVGNLGAQIVGDQAARQSGYQISIPAFTSGKSDGILRRQCTAHYKLDPIRQAVREKLGLQPRQVAAGKFQVRALIGISLDELIRIKPSQETWIENCYPLVNARLTRQDCLKILTELGLPHPVKSACFFCPFHDDTYWAWLKRERPSVFAQAVEVDRRIRDQTRAGVERPVYLHDSRKPLAEVEFDDPRQTRFSVDGFGNECEGLCGV
jgi:hypothetical protein